MALKYFLLCSSLKSPLNSWLSRYFEHLLGFQSSDPAAEFHFSLAIIWWYLKWIQQLNWSLQLVALLPSLWQSNCHSLSMTIFPNMQMFYSTWLPLILWHFIFFKNYEVAFIYDSSLFEVFRWTAWCCLSSVRYSIRHRCQKWFSKNFIYLALLLRFSRSSFPNSWPESSWSATLNSNCLPNIRWDGVRGSSTSSSWE